MLRFVLTAGLAAAIAAAGSTTFSAQAPPASSPAANTVMLDTSKGAIEIEMLPAEAPKSVARFVELAKRGFYRQQRFYWVQSNLIQTGDQASRDMSKMNDWGKGGSGPRFAIRPIGVAELSKRPFVRGLVGLAYITGSKPESADCQFFIVKGATPALNGKYAIMGRVTKGMAVVDKIERLDILKNVTVK